MADLPDYKYVKGLAAAGKLGNLLRVDFSPLKVCSFNCRYCGVGATTRKIIDREEFHPVEDVFVEIRDYVDANGKPDYVMLTGSGEPTLYSGLGRLARTIQDTFPGLGSAIYTNGSLLHRSDVRADVSVCDLVMINLNTVDERTFQRICRPHKQVVLEQLIGGIKRFRAEYRGPLWMDVILVDGINDSDEELDRLMDTVIEISPDLYRVRTVGQAVENVAQPVSAEFVQRLEQKWRDLPLEIEYVL